MAQEPERQANEPAAATKLMIDMPSDFKFPRSRKHEANALIEFFKKTNF
jgi:hypothetical protein